MDNTLALLPTMTASLLVVFGRQDPHMPVRGRRLIHRTLEAAGVDFEWYEFNAAHAFLHDEGARYNPALARDAMAVLLRLLAGKIG